MTAWSMDDMDIVELGELLEFLHDWIDNAPTAVTESLTRFVGADGYDRANLTADLARFAFLVGGDGERFFRTEL